jgi:hypothetical protein
MRGRESWEQCRDPRGVFWSPLEATEAPRHGTGPEPARGGRGPKDPLDLLGMMTPGATGGIWHGAPLLEGNPSRGEKLDNLLVEGQTDTRGRQLFWPPIGRETYE